MSSINTNASALTALQSLAATNRSLETTQGRIATGLRVGSASDNAAYWSIATTMRSDNKANSVVQDALGLGAAKVDTAYTGMNKAIEMVDQMKEKILLAKTADSGDRAKIQSEISALQAGLNDLVKGATYAGTNLLSNDSTTVSGKFTVVSSYNRGGTSTAPTVSTGAIDVARNNTRLVDTQSAAASRNGILDTQFGVTAITADLTNGVEAQAALTGKTLLDIDVTLLTSGGAFDEVLGKVELALSKMATGAAELGAAKSRIDMQKDFVSKLSDSIDRGVGQLVDADMNKESTRLQALQVQQQLGIQALSIANGNSQQILSLFR